jgi:hypothetical protein
MFGEIQDGLIEIASAYLLWREENIQQMSTAFSLNKGKTGTLQDMEACYGSIKRGAEQPGNCYSGSLIEWIPYCGGKVYMGESQMTLSQFLTILVIGNLFIHHRTEVHLESSMEHLCGPEARVQRKEPGIPRWRLEVGSRKRPSYSEILERRWRHTLQA